MKKSLFLSALCCLATATLASATPVTIADVDFTTLDAGPLEGQAGFDVGGEGPAGGQIVPGSGVTLDGFETGVTSLTAPEAAVAAGTIFSNSITFTFDNTTGTNGSPIIGSGLFSGAPNGSGSASAVISRLGDGSGFTISPNATGFGATNATFDVAGSAFFTSVQVGEFASLADVGITDTNSVTDELTLTFTAIATDTSAADGFFDFEVVLTNNETGLDVISFGSADAATSLGVGDGSILIEGADTSGTLFGGFLGAQSDGVNNTADRLISNLTFTATPATVIPEPTSIALVAIGMVGAACRRRR